MAIEREGDVAEAMQVAKLRVAKLRFGSHGCTPSGRNPQPATFVGFPRACTYVCIRTLYI